MADWISVADRLPECDPRFGASNIVWCYDAHGKQGLGIYTDDKCGLRFPSWFTGGGVGENSVVITHWMPLPETPGK